MAKNDEPRIIGMGTDRIAEGQKHKISPRLAQIVPRTQKGSKDQIHAIMILDWNGELHTISMTAPVNLRQALTAVFWSEMTSRMCATFRKGLKDVVK